MNTPVLPSRYEPVGTLGEGGMGQVFRVTDRATGQHVALKRLRVPAGGPEAAQARFLFRQEFAAMAALRHPHLVSALDFGEGPDGVPYMTMAIVPGTDLAVGPPGQSEADVRAWLPQVASALAFLHGRGFVHGDLKPENIRLQPDGTATLMDLGLLATAGRTGEPARGSLAYMAPEVIRQGAIDGRSDLYALGALLYQALTGQAPFGPGNPLVVLRAHLERQPERPSRRNPAISPAMDAAVMRLLAKEPSARFSSAGELLAALDLAGARDEAAGLLASPLLGRDAVQAALRTHWQPLTQAVTAADANAEAATDAEPVARPERSREGPVWLIGPAGAGKTRLLAATRSEAQLAGVEAIALQGLGCDAAPYEALKPLLRSLVDEGTRRQPALAAVLARVLPVAGVEPAAPLEGLAERLRLQAAVVALARAVHPVALWLVDAADALDPASQELLATMQKEPAAAWAWCLAAEAPPAGSQAIALEPLSDPVLLDVARENLGQAELPTGLAVPLLALSAGVPGTCEALLGHWIASQALARENGRWRAGAASFALPGGLQFALDARLDALDPDALRLARVAAILGAGGALPWLAGLAGLDDGRFFTALHALGVEGVLLVDGGSFRFARPGQAIALAASWQATEREQWHDAAAAWKVAEGGYTPGDARASLADALAIAHHLLAGASPGQAAAWVFSAAGQAMAQFTLEPAEGLLRRLEAVGELEAGERLTLDRLQANLARYQGRGKDALARYESSDLLGRLAERNDPLLADETTSYGAMLSLASRYDEARAVLGSAMALADGRGDAAAGVRARVYAGRAAYFAGDPPSARALLAEAVSQGRAAASGGQNVMLAVALSFSGYFMATSGSVEAGLAALAEAVAVASASGNPIQANEALSMRGNVCMAEGRAREAKAAFEAILATCDRFELPYDALMARLNLAAACLELGDAFTARDHAEAVAEASQRRERRFPEAFARAIAGRARLQLGELAVGSEALRTGLAIARAIQNRYLELHVLVPWCDGLIALGRFDEAQATLADARTLARALDNTEHDAVFERLEAKAALQSAMLPGAPLAALATVGERLASWSARLRASRRGGDLAHALMLQAAWALRCDDPVAGVAWTDEAIALAEEAGLALLVAEGWYVRARLSAAAGQVNSAVAGLIHAAVTGFARAGDRAKALGDVRLDALCTAGALVAQGLQRELAPIARGLEALTQGLAPEEAAAFLAQPELQEVMRTATRARLSPEARDVLGLMAKFDEPADLPLLLRRAIATMVEFAGAERGFLLLFEDLDVTHKVVYGMAPDETDAFSTSLAYQVLWSEQPLFVEDAQSDGFLAGQASVRALDLRSVVGVPLALDGSTIGVMIADSQQITSSFGDFHLELLEALARRVGGAIGAARRRMAEDERRALSEMVERLALETAACSDLASFMAPIAAEALALAGADRLCLVVGPALVCQAAFDRAGHRLIASEQAPSQSACRWVYDNNQPLHLHDALSSEAFGAQHSVMALGLRTIHAVPVTHQAQVLGVLYLDDRRVGLEDPHVMRALQRLGALVGAMLTRLGPKAG